MRQRNGHYLFFFFSALAALFCMRFNAGFFLVSFFRSIPLLISPAPHLLMAVWLTTEAQQSKGISGSAVRNLREMAADSSGGA